MILCQFLAPESMNSNRARGFPSCYHTDHMFYMFQRDGDFKLSVRSFRLQLTSLCLSIVPSWQHLNIFAKPSCFFGSSFLELLSPLCRLINLRRFALMELQLIPAALSAIDTSSCYFDFELLYDAQIVLGFKLTFPVHTFFSYHAQSIFPFFTSSRLLTSFLHSLIHFSNLLLDQ